MDAGSCRGQLTEVLRSAGVGTSPATWAEQFSAQLSSVVGADLVSLNGLNADLTLAWAVDWPAGTCHGEIADAVVRLAASHPLVRWGSPHPRRAARLADFHPWSSFRHTELYADIYRPLGLRHEVQIVIAPSQGLVTVAMQRISSDFDDQALERLSLLVPVLGLAAATMWSAVEVELPRTDGSGASRNAPVLTPRERQVLGLLAEGARDGDIARVCGISPTTAKKHVEHIMGKLGVGTRAGAVGFRRDLLAAP